MLEWIIIIAVTLAACAATPSKGRRTAGRSRATRSRQSGRTLTLKAQQVTPRRSSTKIIDPAQIEAIEAQMKAACELGDAYRERGKRQTDPVKRAKDAKLSADAYARADKLQAQIDKIMMAE